MNRTDRCVIAVGFAVLGALVMWNTIDIEQLQDDQILMAEHIVKTHTMQRDAFRELLDKFFTLHPEQDWERR